MFNAFQWNCFNLADSCNIALILFLKCDVTKFRIPPPLSSTPSPLNVWRNLWMAPCECGIEPQGSISHGVSYKAMHVKHSNTQIFFRLCYRILSHSSFLCICVSSAGIITRQNFNVDFVNQIHYFSDSLYWKLVSFSPATWYGVTTTYDHKWVIVCLHVGCV